MTWQHFARDAWPDSIRALSIAKPQVSPSTGSEVRQNAQPNDFAAQRGARPKSAVCAVAGS